MDGRRGDAGEWERGFDTQTDTRSKYAWGGVLWRWEHLGSLVLNSASLDSIRYLLDGLLAT
jgi:hypothetical protein